MTKERTLFDSMVRKIRDAYDNASDLSLGWRFLYSPKVTLINNTRLAIFGYNPGGSVFERPMPSVEAGNAWLTSVERWPSANTQANFMRFMGKVARPYSDGQPANYFKQCLTTNLVPFRSRNANDLPQWAHEWGVRFWHEHFDVIRSQKVIITVGNAGGEARSAFAGVKKILVSNGAVLTEEESWPSGWGDHIVRYRRFTLDADDIALVGVPHFSRFDTRDPNTIAKVSALLAPAP